MLSAIAHRAGPAGRGHRSACAGRMRRGGLLSKMRRHHMMHHIHNDGYWLAFIIPEIDRLFGTGPKPADVPRATGRRPDRRAEAM